MDNLHKLISYLHAWIVTITPGQWYVLGTVVASLFATIGITAWVKRHHLKETAQKLASEFIVLNVAFWGFVGTVASFVVTQGTQFGHLLPYVGTHWAQVSGGAIAVHAVATGLAKWWADRKAGKPIVEASAAPTAVTGPAPIEPVTENLWTSP